MVKRIAIAAVLLATTAHADSEEAKELFEQGRTQRAAGDLDAACKSFDASYAIERAAGTALNLADCEERAGNYEFALELLEGAAKRFDREGRPESAVFARDRAAVLRAAHPPTLRPLPAEPARSNTPLVVAGIGFGVAVISLGVRAQAYAVMKDFDSVSSPTSPPQMSVDQDDCGEVTFTDEHDQHVFERACSAYGRGRIAGYTMLAGTAVGLGALVYYFVAKPKAHSMPVVAPTASGGVAATFEW